MKKIEFSLVAILLTALFALPAAAQIGNVYIHDPSTIVKCDGKYYTFGTGSGGLMSDDGWTWRDGAVRTGGGVAPDVIKIGDRYLVSYSAGYPGTEGKVRGVVTTMWTKTLDPESPDFGYTEPELVAFSGDDEDCWAIDPAFLMDPYGRLWCSYGTYFGAIRIVELDPATGKRMPGNEAVDIAIDCEATALMYKDGWYYLLGTHGTCCDGVNSTYNIVCGRSRSVTGPYLDNMGRNMLQGGGKMVLSAGNRATGPGHFGHFVEEEGVEKMSFHYEGTTTAAAAACWPCAPCSGRTAGRWPPIRSRRVPLRSSPSVAATPWSSPSTSCARPVACGLSASTRTNPWWSSRSRNWKRCRVAGPPATSPSVPVTTCSARTSAGR